MTETFLLGVCFDVSNHVMCDGPRSPADRQTGRTPAANTPTAIYHICFGRVRLSLQGHIPAFFSSVSLSL